MGRNEINYICTSSITRNRITSYNVCYTKLLRKRVAEYLGIPYRRPVPDPIVQDMQTHAIASEQPYIYRLTRLGMAAVLAGRGLAFLEQVSPVLWDGSVDGWDRGRHLGDAIARAGLDLTVLERESYNFV